MPGRGLVDKRLWENRRRVPVSLRQEFMGPKGRGWLMRWLPTQAYENGIYAVFTNPVGLDDDQIRNGNAMVIAPYGEIVIECNSFDDEVVVGLCTPEKLVDSPGRRYIRARLPELYGKLTERGSSACKYQPLACAFILRHPSSLNFLSRFNPHSFIAS